MNSKMLILVDSFDGYSDLWKPFFNIFEAQWNNCPYKVKLVSNEKAFEDVVTIKTGKELFWSDRTLKALEQTDEKYIMLLLEDYLIGKKVNSSEIQSLIDFMELNDGKYIRLTNIPKSRFAKKNEKIFQLYSDEEYAINLQASIWEREFLIESLKKYSGSAWEFEIGFLKNSIDAEHEALTGCYGVNQDPLAIINGVLKGKWFPLAIKYCRQFDFDLEWQNRGKLSMIDFLKYEIVFLIKNLISYEFRKKLKRILRKFGMKFVSDL